MSVRAPVVVLATLVAIIALIGLEGDVALAQGLRGIDPTLKRVAGWVTLAGDAAAYLVLSALAAVYFGFVRRDERKARLALLVLAGIGLSGILVNLLKFLFGRTRPGMLYDQGIEAFFGPTLDSAIRSFPSGHATTVAAAATLVILLSPRWRVPALVFAGTVGISRLLVGYHFLSDVLAGFLVGWVSALLAHRLFVRQGWWPAIHGAQAAGRGR